VADIGVGGERFAFDADVWAEEVGRFREGGPAHGSALAARARMERPDARIAVRPCDAEGPDATALAGCGKVYVPLDAEPSRAPYAFVFAFRTEQRTGGAAPARIRRAPSDRRPQRLRPRPQAPTRTLPGPVAPD
jgi:hypothetical protein